LNAHRCLPPRGSSARFLIVAGCGPPFKDFDGDNPPSSLEKAVQDHAAYDQRDSGKSQRLRRRVAQNQDAAY
jgi:hypothetical protein